MAGNDWLRTPLQPLAALLMALAIALAAGCGSEQSGGEQETADKKKDGPPLRILTLRDPAGSDFLPRDGLPESTELELAKAYAAAQGRPPEIVFVDALAELIPALLEGKGDIAVSNLTATEDRKEKVAFTTPVTFVREVVIGRKGEAFENAHGLKDRTVVVRAGSSFERTLQHIRKRRFQPEFEISTLPAGTSDQALLERVAESEEDLAVLDSNTAKALLAGRDDLQIAMRLGNV
ncbi:MAG TPA: transporter substrate-binding domain-containing protein, partial [Gammaproteobacteria bacterium]|nr:transporter substrate-binding domain-containing protein [Gammaproteobacteria bacterium]